MNCNLIQLSVHDSLTLKWNLYTEKNRRDQIQSQWMSPHIETESNRILNMVGLKSQRYIFRNILYSMHSMIPKYSILSVDILTRIRLLASITFGVPIDILWVVIFLSNCGFYLLIILIVYLFLILRDFFSVDYPDNSFLLFIACIFDDINWQHECVGWNLSYVSTLTILARQ